MSDQELMTGDAVTVEQHGADIVPSNDATVSTPRESDDKLDSIISAALDKAEGKTQDTPQDGERARDPATGRFVTKDTAEAKPSPEGEPAKAEATPAETPAATVVHQPPERWDEAAKAEFAKLPPEAQSLVLARHSAMEADHTRKTQELADQRKSVEPLLAEVGRWDGYLKQLGVAPQEAFSQMLATEYQLRTGSPEQKVQALAYLAQHYGVDLSPHRGDAPESVDPHFTELRNQNRALQQQLQQIQADLRQRDEAARVAERQRAEHEFNALAQTKDETGQLKFPHFERVRQSMIQLVASGQADSWEGAYAKASRLDDDLHKEIVEAERKRALEAAEKARLEAVTKAEKARPVTTSPSLLAGKTSMKGIDAHIAAALDRAGL